MRGALGREFTVTTKDTTYCNVAGVIEPTLQAAEIRRAVDRPSNNPTTYDLYLRALQTTESWEKKDYLEALDWLSQATKQDASYSPALALSALYHTALSASGWADDPEAAMFARPCCTISFAARCVAVLAAVVELAANRLTWAANFWPSFAPS